MSSDPVVTLIVPVFNRGELFELCLRSIVAQTIENWRTIVVDDGSQEDIKAVVDRVGDPRIDYVRHEKNRGIAAARNSGIRTATTELVVTVDSDDELAPRFLETLLDARAEVPERNLIYHYHWLIGDETGLREFPLGDLRELLIYPFVPGSGVLMTKDLWERAGTYCESPDLMGDDDWDFWISAFAAGCVPHAIEEPLYLYRMHGGSLTAQSLRYHGATHVHLMYWKHKSLYDSYGLGRRFLGWGNRRAARAAWERKERLRAMRFAAISVWFDWRRLRDRLLRRQRAHW